MGYASAEAVLVAWAKATAALSTLCGGRIATRLPEKPTFPFLCVRRVSGAPDSSGDQWDTAMVQWDCYGARYADGKASRDAAAAEALGLELLNQADWQDGWVVQYGGGALSAKLGGLSVLSHGMLPEEVTQWAHYQVTMLASIQKLEGD